MDQRTKALTEAAAFLRASADANVPAIRHQAKLGFYLAASNMDAYRRNLEDAARIVESMLEKFKDQPQERK